MKALHENFSKSLNLIWEGDVFPTVCLGAQTTRVCFVGVGFCYTFFKLLRNSVYFKQYLKGFLFEEESGVRV